MASCKGSSGCRQLQAHWGSVMTWLQQVSPGHDAVLTHAAFTTIHLMEVITSP